jgi:hydroxymethylpyrimidine pyrophosphatase-like HAD family hydrolase
MEARFSPDVLSITYSDRRFLELMGGGVDKGRGLREVCRIHGIDVKRSAAMGDEWNDLTLLEAAGDAWVMESAPESLKKRFAADRIALDSDRDGAAIVMEAMLLAAGSSAPERTR